MSSTESGALQGLACVAGRFSFRSLSRLYPPGLMSDRASSVSFRVGPPSPASPAAGFLKENHPPFLPSDQIPQTPASPPLMSVSAQSHASNFASSQASPSQATSQPANLSSPPSSTPMSTQVSQQPTLSTTNSFPTPASSVSGHLVGNDSEHADKLMGAGMQESGEITMAETNTALTQPAEHARTDHDRQFEGIDPGTGIRDFANTDRHHPVKDEDAMDLDSKNEATASLDNGGLSLDSLQREFTSAYHLCKSCKSSPISILAAAVEKRFAPHALLIDVFWD